MDSSSKLTQDITKAHSLNMWGSNPATKLQFKAEHFLELIKESPLQEIMAVNFHGRSLQFTIDINGEKYEAHSLISQKFIDQDRLYRKAQLTDFKEISITKKNFLPLHFQISNAQNPTVQKLLETALKILDSGGDISSEVNQPKPTEPNLSS